MLSGSAVRTPSPIPGAANRWTWEGHVFVRRSACSVFWVWRNTVGPGFKHLGQPAPPPGEGFFFGRRFPLALVWGQLVPKASSQLPPLLPVRARKVPPPCRINNSAVEFPSSPSAGVNSPAGMSSPRRCRFRSAKIPVDCEHGARLRPNSLWSGRSASSSRDHQRIRAQPLSQRMGLCSPQRIPSRIGAPATPETATPARPFTLGLLNRTSPRASAAKINGYSPSFLVVRVQYILRISSPWRCPNGGGNNASSKCDGPPPSSWSADYAPRVPIFFFFFFLATRNRSAVKAHPVPDEISWLRRDCTRSVFPV